MPILVYIHVHPTQGSSSEITDYIIHLCVYDVYMYILTFKCFIQIHVYTPNMHDRKYARVNFTLLSWCLGYLNNFQADESSFPHIEILGCPTTPFNHSKQKYEVKFQWRILFSPAALSYIDNIRLREEKVEKGRSNPLEVTLHIPIP